MMGIHSSDWVQMVVSLNLLMHLKTMCITYENVSAQEGALVEPTAVAVQAVKEGNLLFGDTVAIFGAGQLVY